MDVLACCMWDPSHRSHFSIGSFTMAYDPPKDNAFSLPNLSEFQDEPVVTCVDDLFGDTSHISEAVISDILLNSLTSRENAGTRRFENNNSFQAKNVTSAISNSTSTSHSLATLSTTKEASSCIHKATNSTEDVLYENSSFINVPNSGRQLSDTKASAIFEAITSGTYKQNSDSKTEPVETKTLNVEPCVSSVSQNEECWILPPKRKPGRKPSRPGHPKQHVQTEEKGSREYLLKRARNNIAIKKCREKAKLKQKETDTRLLQLQLENDQLKKENSDLKISITELKKELETLKNSAWI